MAPGSATCRTPSAGLPASTSWTPSAAVSYLSGFRNADVARHLFPSVARTAQERRRRTAAVSRKLQLLRAHGLIAPVPHSYRYQITRKGENLMNAAIAVRSKAFPKELPEVA